MLAFTLSDMPGLVVVLSLTQLSFAAPADLSATELSEVLLCPSLMTLRSKLIALGGGFSRPPLLVPWLCMLYDVSNLELELLLCSPADVL